MDNPFGSPMGLAQKLNRGPQALGQMPVNPMPVNPMQGQPWNSPQMNWAPSGNPITPTNPVTPEWRQSVQDWQAARPAAGGDMRAWAQSFPMPNGMTMPTGMNMPTGVMPTMQPPGLPFANRAPGMNVFGMPKTPNPLKEPMGAGIPKPMKPNAFGQ